MTKAIEYFTTREIGTPGRYIIVPKNYETFPFNTIKGGSYAVAPARVLGLQFHEYLIFLRQMFPNEVQVVDKKSIYPTAHWKKGVALNAFVKMLNLKLTLAEKARKTIV